jgi:ribosomal protein L7/L12
MDSITRQALDYVARNGERYRREFCRTEFGSLRLALKIPAIKQLREDFTPPGGGFLGLKEAKDAIEAWEADRLPFVIMSSDEAKILLKNLLLRGGQSGLTPLEVEAIRRLSE